MSYTIIKKMKWLKSNEGYLNGDMAYLLRIDDVPFGDLPFGIYAHLMIDGSENQFLLEAFKTEDEAKSKLEEIVGE